MGTTGQSVTLANSIIGVGILAMPFCYQQCGLVLATLILMLMGLVSRLCCYFLLKSALLARRRNFEFLAFHVFGPAGKMAVEVGIIGFLMGTCIAYFVVVGDLGPQIIAKMFNINQSDILRTSIMVIVSLVCVLPLGLLRNVDSLSNVSAATIAFYFCLVIKVIAEAASQIMSGEWQRRVEMWKWAGVLQCVPIFSMALFCQTQLFEIFESLPTLSLEKMSVVTKNAINICTGVYFTLGVFGYIAFSSQEISGNILMSLSPTMASDVIKLGFVMSLAFSFPLIIFPCRASLYSFLYKKVHSTHHDHIINHSIPQTTFRCITVAIIAVALCISLLLPNIELVLGLVGSTIGVLICVVFPAACFVNVTFKNTNERILAKGIIILGLVILVLGTYANLQAAESKLDKYDDKYITKERIDKIVEDFFEKRKHSDELVDLVPEKVENPQIEELNRNNDIVKDSEVQPPNPLPPESQSNEKHDDAKVADEKTKNEDTLKEILPIDEVEKASETHPKNLKSKLNEAKVANGALNEELIGKMKVESSKENKATVNEDKIKLMKQQKLLENMKQYGEEQKELNKEQKEIIDEIINSQNAQKNKNDVDPMDAKKIAVESIKQIANIAIQSLGAGTEKPSENKNDKSMDRVEKLTNEAVQEIAKKAAETLEIIQEIKEKESPQKNEETVKNEVNQNPKNDKQSVDNTQYSGVVAVPEVKAPGANNAQFSIQNVPLNPQDNDKVVSKNIDKQVKLDQHPEANIQQSLPLKDNSGAILPPNLNSQISKNEAEPKQSLNDNINQQSNVNKEIPINLNQQVQANVIKAMDNKQQSNIAQNVHTANIVNGLVNQPPQGNDIIEKQQELHSHSPDEPQSYKQGEDAQQKYLVNKDIVQNVPIPLANLHSKALDTNLNKASSNNVANQGAPQNYGANNNVPQNPAPVRQKREVVDCTKKTVLKPEDKEICEKLVDNGVSSENILPKKFDLDLPVHLPIAMNVLSHHISRSLQSYDDDKR